MKMKKIFYILFVFFQISAYAQNAQFDGLRAARCRISQVGGGSGFWTAGITEYNNPRGTDATEITPGDYLHFNDGGISFNLRVTLVVSAVGQTATIRVSNVGIDDISSLPSGAAVIFKGSDNYKLPPWVANTTGNDNQLLSEYFTKVLDDALASKIDTLYLEDGTPIVNGDTISGSAIDTSYVRNDSVFVVTGGAEVFTGLADVNVPADGNGIYGGDGTAPADVDANITDSLNFDNGTLLINALTNRVAIGQSTTGPTAQLSVRRDGIGVTQENQHGIVLANNRPATSTLNQMSPGIRWRANSWKSNAPAESQSLDFVADVLTSTGGSAGTGTWSLKASVNGAPYSTFITVDQAGSGSWIRPSAGNIGIINNNALVGYRGGASGHIEVGALSGSFRNVFRYNTVHDNINADNWYFGYNTPASQHNNSTSGTGNWIGVEGNFRPTSGTANYSNLTIYPTINQTGGANGITRGLFVNPTLTSAADWRAIETTNGTVVFSDTYRAVGGNNAGELLQLSQTWNTTGSPTAIRLNVTNTASANTARLMDFLVNGLNVLRFEPNGDVVSRGRIRVEASGMFGFNGLSHITSPVAGVMRLSDWGGNNFNRLQFGGTSLAFPSLKRDGASLLARLADDSAPTSLRSSEQVSAHTANVAITADDVQRIYTNEGTTIQVRCDLPAAVAGLAYTFVVQDADGIMVTSTGNDTIRIEGTVSTAPGAVTSVAIGSVITLTAINSTEWIATYSAGTWTF